MECNVREISNAVMIDSLDTIIEQENRKLEMDKNTGLLARKSKVLKVVFVCHVNYDNYECTLVVKFQNISE